MKRFIALALSIVMIFSLAACGDENTVAGNNSAVGKEETGYSAGRASGTNLVGSGSFDDSSGWGLYLEGGSAEFAVSDGNGRINISGTGDKSHSVQLYFDGFELYEKGEYEFVFTAWSEKDKVCQARIQQNGGSYQAYCEKTVTLTEEPQTFSIPFTMTEVNDPQRIVFNVGTNSGKAEKAQDYSEPFAMYFDDVQINVVSEKNAVLPMKETTACARLNQVGYRPDDTKLVYFEGSADVGSYEICTEEGTVVHSGKTSDRKYSSAGGDEVRIGDFSDFTAPGTYYISTAAGNSYTFTIGEDVYKDSFDSIVKMLYLQRCGCELTEEYAGSFAHGECHTEKALVHGTEDEYIDVSGGWHDAGDYGRYIVPAAKTVADLIWAYEDNPGIFGDDLGIPESGNNIPDVLDEVRYELEWMLKMQRADGGVYHKVNTKRFCGNVPPTKDNAQLYAFAVSTPATADFAAAMAMASETYSEIDPDFAKKCLDSAVLAWNFLEKNGTISFHNPSDTETGEYPDGNDGDERFWAAAALYSAIGEEKYHDAVKAVASSGNIYRGKGWADMGSFGTLLYLSLDESRRDEETCEKLRSDFIAYADSLMKTAESEAYGISLSEYPWGSNMIVADNGVTLIQAYEITGNEKYLDTAEMHFHYLYGLNPMGISYVTGSGTEHPENPHHRMSAVAGEAMPGMVIGGPNQNREDNAARTHIKEGTAPMKCYIDNYDSYSTNEITIYWNSPLICLMAAIEKQ